MVEVGGVQSPANSFKQPNNTEGTNGPNAARGGKNTQNAPVDENSAGDNKAAVNRDPGGISEDGLRTVFEENSKRGGESSNNNVSQAQQNAANQNQRGQNVDELV